jgi:hypothetical protein
MESAEALRGGCHLWEDKAGADGQDVPKDEEPPGMRAVTHAHEGYAQPARMQRGQAGARSAADVAGLSQVPVQMWELWAQSRSRRGRGSPGPSADAAGVSPTPSQM